MGTVTTIGFTLRWARPVYVGKNDVLDTVVAGPADALRWMEDHFGDKHGFLYWRAHTLCYDALLGAVHHDFARQPFVDALVQQSTLE